jgi:hypothetical protein
MRLKEAKFIDSLSIYQKNVMSKKHDWCNELLTQDVVLLRANSTRALTELSVRGVGASILQLRLCASPTSTCLGFQNSSFVEGISTQMRTFTVKCVALAITVESKLLVQGGWIFLSHGGANA